jgi:alpha-glucosidase (family GH31 glycosyl hydrolase)
VTNLRLVLSAVVALTAGAAAPCIAAGLRNDPVAEPAAVVTSGEARFTFLTSRLIRMEWSPEHKFEDHASLVFINRRLPAPPLTQQHEEGWLIIRTPGVELRYREGSGRFAAGNLEVRFPLGGEQRSWRPGMSDTANLRGTTRTLDGVEGATALEPGLLSRDGWVLVDDSGRPLYDESEWPWVMSRPAGERQDYYLFAHGREYRRALRDFVSVAGRIPMPPRFAFGLWWSRYWAYADRELRDLVDEFKLYDVPLDVLVVDMDWHETFDLRWDTDKRDQAGQRLGWTGYTWNRSYFPDPPAFLSWCESRGLKTTLNLHPASGIQPHEGAYPAMARAMGIVPDTRTYVPFDIVNRTFATNYFDLVIRPLERQGVDFWWLDWQQWGTTTIPGVTPTWWLNYVFFTDMERQGKNRPLIFHRWGGLGNHRYQIGFSGDAISVWESLRFQPGFTATAANVCFGYWSHDIGGHMPGPVSAELYTRWVQWGAFSPILRTHTTKNPAAERRMWAYPPEYFRIMRDAVRLRYSLIPYIYTAAREAYDTGLSIVRPMYLHWPEAPEAYEVPGQYMFGNDLLVSPVTDSLSSPDRLNRKRIWLPPGAWYEWRSGALLEGNRFVERRFALDEIPLYCLQGAVIPMQEEPFRADMTGLCTLGLMVVPGDTGSTRIYEDAGNSSGYTNDEYRWTTVQTEIEGSTMRLRILPVAGGWNDMPRGRDYVVRFAGTVPPASVQCNGRTAVRVGSPGMERWEYDGDRATLLVRTGTHAVSETVEVVVRWDGDVAGVWNKVDGFPGRLARLQQVIPWLNVTWPEDWSPDVLIAASQTGLRLSTDPSRAAEELKRFPAAERSVLQAVRQMKIPEDVQRAVIGHLGENGGDLR